MKTNREREEQIRRLIRIVNDRLIDLQVLKGGFIMTNEVFKLVLKEHPHIKKEFEMLHARKFKLQRAFWKN